MTSLRWIAGLLVGVALATPIPAIHQEQVRRGGNVDADAEISVRSIAGTVRITGWDRDEVSVEGTLGQGSERLEFSNDGAEVEIEVVVPRSRRRNREQPVEDSHLEIMVPRGAALEVETLGASIAVTDVDGAVKLESTAGNVTYSGAASEIEVDSASGDVEIDATAPRAAVAVEGVAGDVFVRVVDGTVAATALTGNVRILAGTLREGRFESVSGGIYFEGAIAGGGELDFESFSGDIELIIPDDTAADFEIRAYSGSIETAFGYEARRVEAYSPEQAAEFTLGAGGAEVSIETFSGSVAVRRR